ncbi:hypothetical protein [Phycicoccus sonneratiae]|uniref:DUF998 domain-containing protein n=1 Tax=Phycicoccus sonneratiae TaxID=2807628 RepID=A0ABS2CII0_9MICO|nr:hypothetical protein [Phycicoccus sonneraticus]MBM6399681.1 hypothetical protein [Phycicoccus sonneraticus]
MQPDPALAAVRTYGYLRLALAGLVLLLFTAVLVEFGATGFDCLQTSISAYWHTPARAVFVGVLVTMGVCLVALKGNTPGEDVALNFAGMLAPGVAFIPTSDPGTCSSVPIQPSDVVPAVTNNMQSLFVLGAVALAVGVVSARRAAGPDGLRRGDLLGLGVAFAVMGGGAVWFYVARDSFVAHGHDVSAIPMFLAIVVAVWLNGRDVGRAMTQGSAGSGASRYVRTYRMISTAMLVTLAATVAANLLSPWDHLVLAVEVVLILLFAAFWLVQTKELWDRGLRSS